MGWFAHVESAIAAAAVRGGAGIRSSSEWGFIFRLLLLGSGFGFLLGALAHVLQPFASWTAATVARSSSLLILAASNRGSVVTFDNKFSYVVELGCTGLSAAIFFVAAVLAYPTNAKAKFLGCMIGAPTILGINLVRLDSMGWVGVHIPNLVEAAHQFWWQVTIILAGSMLFLLWVHLFAHEDAATAARWGRLSDLAWTFAMFLPLFGTSAWIAGRIGFADAYEWLVTRLAHTLATLVWANAPWAAFRPGLSDESQYVLVCLAYTCLFLATHGVPIRRRISGALCWSVLPAILAGTLKALLVAAYLTRKVQNRPVLTALTFLALFAIPFAAWTLWIPHARQTRV